MFFTITCSTCNAATDPAPSIGTAITRAEAVGWTYHEGLWTCPTCGAPPDFIPDDPGCASNLTSALN